MPRKPTPDADEAPAKPNEAKPDGDAAGAPPTYKIGDKLLLTVREPIDRGDARAETPGNYIPQRLVAQVEGVNLEGENPTITVRWHLPAAYGHDTRKGVVSNLLHIADGVWIETRKRARNVIAMIEEISEDDFKALVEELAAV
jgi:hypothetical protein